jgi:hypothetical protein
MDDDLMLQILSMGSDEDAIAELLRQAERQEGIADETRGRDYLMDAGRMKVANPWGAVSDMFVRGNAEKKAEAARGQVPNARATMNEKLRDFVNSSQNKGIGGIDMDEQAPTQAAIAGPRPMPMPQAPQVPPPAPAGPVGPPGPQAAPGGAPAAPAAPAGPPPMGAPPAGRPGPFLANAPQPEPSTDEILAMLRSQGGLM